MGKNERLEQILEILATDTYISNRKLSERLFVSLPTIRRDLTFLEKEGLVIRSHGGAKVIDNTTMPFDFRNTYNTGLKKHLCKKAAAMISDGDVIFIDSSSTAVNIAKFITAEGVVAVTNGIPAAEALRRQHIKTYVTGGVLSEGSQCCLGSECEEFISKFNFDIVFFSSVGINENGMIVDVSLEETAVRQKALANGKRKVFMRDKEEINADAPYNVISVDKVDYVITND